MTLSLWVQGKLEVRQYLPLIEEYVCRINRYIPFEIEEISSPMQSAVRKKASLLKEYEADQVFRRLKSGDRLLLLDEKGDLYNSKGWAELFEKRLSSGFKRWVWLIGGPYGFSERLYREAEEKLSLSPLTFPHDMARLIVCEQCYRAVSILNHLPYHHD